MRSVRIRIIATLVVLAAVGVGGWQLLPSDETSHETIAVGTTDKVTSLDPAGAYDAGSWALYSNVFQSLLTFEPGGVAPVPDAASSCAFTGKDLRTFRCTLRPGLTFPSGRAVTADDVKYSFDRVRTIKSEVGPSSLFGGLSSVKADGRTVTFRLKTPDATFPFKVATGAGSIVDRRHYPADSLRKGDTVDGTGPYVLKRYEKGVRAELRPNPGYRGAVKDSGDPVDLHYYKDSATLDKAWQDKKIAVAARQLPPKVLAGLSPGDEGQRVTESDSAEVRNLYLNLREGSPLHDVRIRQALASLIDRDKLVDSVYRGTVDPLYSLVPRGITGHTTAFFDRYPRPDKAKARQLLQAAGVTTPVRFEFAYSPGGATAEEAAEVKKQLNATGLFKVTTKAYEWTDFQKKFAGGKLDAYAVGWVADFPDPDTFTDQLVGTDSSMKTGYSNKDVDRLIRSTQQYSDRGRTTVDLRDLQEDVAHDVPLIPLWQRKDYVLSTEEVTGGQYLSDGTGVFRLWRLGRL